MLTKAEVIAAFGGTGAATSRALGLKRGAVWAWPDPLTPVLEDRVRGAALRLGVKLPPAEPGPTGAGGVRRLSSDSDSTSTSIAQPSRRRKSTATAAA